MIRSYILVAVRNLFRRKYYSLLNLVGLTLGIVSCTLVFILLRFEFSFDTFHSNTDRIYRVVRHVTSEEGVSGDCGSPFVTAKTLREEGAPMAQVTQLHANTGNQIDILDASMNDTGKRFKESNTIGFLEPEFFQVFNFPWIEGDPSMLDDPKTVALTEEMAVKYYGSAHDAMNKYLRLGTRSVYRVGGVIKNIPANSDFKLGVMFSFKILAGLMGGELPDWNSTNSNSQCFVLLNEGQSPESFASSLSAISKKYLSPTTRDSYHIQPLRDIHFNPEYGTYRGRVADKQMLNVFGMIGLLILVISCINFINMALAKSFQRSKEVGIRKTLGSGRNQLVFLYLAETSLLVTASLALAMVVTEAILPIVGPLINLPADVRWIGDPLFIGFLAATLLLITLIAGLYPALRTASFKPAQALKDSMPVTSGGFPLRKVLIVVQFFIAQGLIFCMIVITDQTSYFMNTSLGFKQEAIVTVNVPTDSLGSTNREPFRNRLLQSGIVKNVSYGFRSPATRKGNWWTDYHYNRAEQPAPDYANLKWAEPEFFNTYGLELIAGRMYSPTDTAREVIVNEQLLATVGVTDVNEAIGRPIKFWDREYPIVGVVKDFHIHGLRNELMPVILAPNAENYSQVNVSLEPGKVKEGLQFLESSFRETYPNHVFEYEFVDEMVSNFYSQEENFSKLFWIFATLAIVIGCLGLFGMVSLTVLRRTKEIGVRKVLGAPVHGLVTLLSRDFLVLVLVASLAALPLGWWLMDKWLADFAYPVTISWMTFIVSVLTTLIIAWITLSFQTIKAAMANPVKSLRTE